jgi:hypothetical protein
MRLRVGIIFFLCVGLTGFAGAQDRRRDQIEAAHTDAMASMMDAVRTSRIHNDLTVGQFLDKTGGDARLREALRGQAQQIGATRWPNPETCQVQLEVSGAVVAAELIDIGSEKMHVSPVPAEALRKQLADWEGRTFSASGAAMTPEMAVEMRPGPEQPLWLSVPEADRKAAVQAAQHDAGRRAVEGLNDVQIGDGKTVADALQVPAVRKVIQEWVAARPVVDLRFGSDGEVLMTLAAPAEELWDVFRQAVTAQDEVPVPQDEAGWRRLHDEVVARLKMPMGRGAISRAPRADPPPRRALPVQSPHWVADMMDADGTARAEPDQLRGMRPAEAQLRLARMAEAKANEQLRSRIEALPLGDGRTIGEAARSDGRLAMAVERSLRRARTYNIDYGDERSATVRVGLDLRYVWQELNRR